MSTIMRSVLRAVLLTVALGVPIHQCLAQAAPYPRRPITIVVPFSAGAGTDQIARILAEKLSPKLGQPVIVVNRVGASGIIGTAFAAKAPADGYTLLYVPSSFAFAPMVANVGRSGGYDPLKDFTPIIEVGTSQIFLVTNSYTGFKTFKEAETAARSKPMYFGSAGSGSILHVVGEAVNRAVGIKLIHVPYKGVAPAVADAIGGQIPFVYASLSTIKPHFASGKLVPLAVTSRDRSKLAPDIPTLVELGYPSVDFGSWNGLFGPKGIPTEVLKTLNDHLNEILKMPDVVHSMALQGMSPTGGPPEILGETNARDFEVFGKLIKELGIQSH